MNTSEHRTTQREKKQNIFCTRTSSHTQEQEKKTQRTATTIKTPKTRKKITTPKEQVGAHGQDTRTRLPKCAKRDQSLSLFVLECKNDPTQIPSSLYPKRGCRYL